MTYEDLRRRLESSPDPDVRRLVRILKGAFTGGTLPDVEAAAEARRKLAETVLADFPSPFAQQFQRWSDGADRFYAALEGQNREAIVDLFGLSEKRWLLVFQQIVNFLPFVFIGSLLRPEVRDLPDPERAVPLLARIIRHYISFYYADDTRQKESDQVDLLVYLLSFFRRLWRSEPFASAFVLRPLAERSGGFEQVIPRRFDAHLHLLRQMRNVSVHRFLHNRSAEVLESVHRVCEASIVDMVTILTPIFRDYHVLYAVGLEGEGDTLRAVGLSLCGPDSRRYTYSLKGRPASDRDKIERGQLYLVRRGIEIDAEGNQAAVKPVDYLNLTPFLLYETRRRRAPALGGPAKGVAARTAVEAALPAEREVFLFWRYTIKQRAAQYLAYDAGDSFDISGDQDWGLQWVLDEISLLRRDFDTLNDLVVARQGAVAAGDRAGIGLAPAEFEQRTWDLSRAHLLPLVDVDAYGADGARQGESRERTKRPYVEELFVAPAEAEPIARFLAGEKRGLLVVGPSGIGKSNLLCDAFLKLRRAREPCLFLNARAIEGASLAEHLLKQVGERLFPPDSGMTLARYLAEQNQRLVVFVDSINEYVGPGGAETMLRGIVDLVGDAQTIPGLQVVATMRPELWSSYAETVQGDDEPTDHPDRVLDPQFFFQAEPVRVRPFMDDAARTRLYAAYQRFFALRPQRYEDLSSSIQQLIDTPFMMAVIAETYANLETPGEQAQPLRVPRDLDYFRVFQALTARKVRSAGRLLSRSSRDLLQPALTDFARLMLSRLVGMPVGRSAVDLAASGTALPATDAKEFADALPWTTLGTTEVYRDHWVLDEDTRRSRFDALREVGLIDVTTAVETGYFGRSSGRYCRFFHEQYTQFMLGHVYHRELLGALSPRLLRDPARLDGTVAAVAWLVAGGVRTPVLAGALDHWLRAGLIEGGDDGLALLLGFLDRLAVHPSGAVRHYAGSFLGVLVQRAIVPADKLYGALFKFGSPALRQVVAEAFMEQWAAVSPRGLRAFIAACEGEGSAAILKRLAEVMVLQFALAPAEVAAYIRRALHRLASIADLPGALIGREALGREVTFILEFVVSVLLTMTFSPPHMAQLRDLLSNQYPLVINILTDRSTGYGVLGSIPEGAIRKWAYRKIEEQGVSVWNEVVAPVGGNDKLFEEDPTTGQHAMLQELLPYLVQIHNNEVDASALEVGSPMRTLLIRMMNYGVCSNVGYISLVAVTTLARTNWRLVEELAEELVTRGTAGGRFFGSMALVNVTYGAPGLGPAAIKAFNDKIIPWVLAKDAEADWPILGIFGVLATDVAGSAEEARKGIAMIFDHIGKHWDQARIDAYATEVSKAAFFLHPGVGRLVADMLVERGALTDPVWRVTLMKLLAAILGTNPRVLREIAQAHRLGDDLIRELRDFTPGNLAVMRDTHRHQVGWNEVIARSLVYDVRLRYMFIQGMVGGIARVSSVEACAREFRRVAITMLDTYLGSQPGIARFARLDMNDMVKS